MPHSQDVHALFRRLSVGSSDGLPMFTDLPTLILALAPPVMIAVVVWGISLRLADVSIVDSIWSILIISAGFAYAMNIASWGWRDALILTLASAWALRLSAHITLRSLGEPEDRRYRAIRERNEPNFEFKSLYLVFLLQAVLAWIVSFALFGSLCADRSSLILDVVATALVVVGIVVQAVADWQLEQFKASPDSTNRVLDSGLWRYSRHPNYFGEFVIWWGFFIFSVSAGVGWTIVSPLLMSVLLLRVSGVTLLESDIQSRRPGYAEYVEKTNAFFPWFPKSKAGGA